MKKIISIERNYGKKSKLKPKKVQLAYVTFAIY